MKHQKFFLIAIMMVFIISCFIGTNSLFAAEEQSDAYIYTPETDEEAVFEEPGYTEEETDRYNYEDPEAQEMQEEVYIDDEMNESMDEEPYSEEETQEMPGEQPEE